MPTVPQNVFVGIDVSKDWLDVAVRPTGAAWRAAQDEDGLERAVHTYASSPAPDLARTLFTVVEQYVGDVKLVDDLTVVVVKRTAVASPPSL